MATFVAISFLAGLLIAGRETGVFSAGKGRSNQLAIFALPTEVAADSLAVTEDGIALVELVIRAINSDTAGTLRALPLDWLSDAIPADSLANLLYLQHIGASLGFSHFLLGKLSNTGDSARCEIQLYASGGGAPVFTGRFRYPAENPTRAAATILSYISDNLHLNFAVYPDTATVPATDFVYRLALLRQDFEALGRLLQTRLAADSTDWRVLMYRAELLWRQPAFETMPVKKREKLLRDVCEALADFSDRDSTNAEIAAVAGTAFYWREKFNEAAFYVLRALRHEPCEARALKLLAKLHFSRYRPLGFLNEVEIYQRALACNPGDIEAVVDLAAAHLQLKETRKAQKLLESYRDVFPDNLLLLKALGQIYVSRGMTLQIFETYQKLLDQNPRDAEVFYNLGIYYFNVEDLQTAEKFFAKAIQLGNHPNSRLYLAKIAEKRGDLQSAVGYLQERVRLKTGETDVFAEEARRHLFDLMLGLGKIDSSGKVLQQD